ncbi:type II toxin-antitoxin system ParD family antitoxin [Rhizobium sp. NRK18]|jgi:antitoxin ParD1/3/4|uniref:ribbon-helix-helix domain-containing protein n=1 Tax=Rhizobium sp. NRK18 TaxID=2964667 RepID=UPI0021C3AC5E|nr:amino acid ABC transporter [Rhizobium sp. NRK18]MCQ2004978.1 amino acid ABC transporter [Rhizobium sp. NRK18]
MPMIAVSVSPQQAAQIRAAVENGGYASGSQVVREALHLWSESLRAEGQVEPDDKAPTITLGDKAYAGRVCIAELFDAHRNRSRA